MSGGMSLMWKDAIAAATYRERARILAAGLRAMRAHARALESGVAELLRDALRRDANVYCGMCGAAAVEVFDDAPVVQHAQHAQHAQHVQHAPVLAECSLCDAVRVRATEGLVWHRGEP